MTLRANTEIVAATWLRGVAGLSSAMVATQLPKDTSTWATTGFVTIRATGGSPGIHVPLRAPVVTIDTWSVSASSAKPPWFAANYLAELIDLGCRAANAARTLTLPTGYPGARVLSAYLLQEPRRAYGDQGDYGHYVMDMLINWIDLS